MVVISIRKYPHNGPVFHYKAMQMKHGLCMNVAVWFLQSQSLIIHIPYNGKFSKGLIFKNFESSQAFVKLFFKINDIIMHVHFWNVS